MTLDPRSQYNTTAQIQTYIHYLAPASLRSKVKSLVAMYPKNVAAGSPFGTGSNVFGKSEGFKRLAAIITDVSIFSEPA